MSLISKEVKQATKEEPTVHKDVYDDEIFSTDEYDSAAGYLFVFGVICLLIAAVAGG